MRRVLVIEDETILRSNVARGIAKIGVEVLEASSLNDALRIIDREPPDVIVSDIDMPERSGLELLGELGRRALKIPVIYVSGYLNAYRAQIPHHAAVEVLEKPVPIEELREVVSRRLGAPRTADAAPFSVPDYVQLACLGRHSVQVDVEHGGEHLGTVVVANGELWSARDRLGAGLPALGRLAFGGRGAARCRSFTGALPERNLEGGWEYIMMEAARVSDETEREAEVVLESAFERMSGAPSEARPETRTSDRPAGPLSGRRAAGSATERDPFTAAFEEAWDAAPLTVDPRERAFEEAWEEGVDALLSKNYSAAVSAFVRAAELRPEDPKVRANLKRLAELGHPRSGAIAAGE